MLYSTSESENHATLEVVEGISEGTLYSLLQLHGVNVEYSVTVAFGSQVTNPKLCLTYDDWTQVYETICQMNILHKTTRPMPPRFQFFPKPFANESRSTVC